MNELSEPESADPEAGAETKPEQEDQIEQLATDHSFALVSIKDVDILARAIDSRDMELRDPIRAIVQRLARNRFRKLACWPDGTETSLAALSREFPNMVHVVNMLADLVCLAKLGNGVFSIPPILLSGPPGIGKTEFADMLAKILGVNVLKVNMASAQADFTLAGSDKRYANTQMGEIANCLIYNSTGNTIVLLDELDKAADVDHHNPTKALLQLLEKRSAAEFKDASLPELKLDASNLVWIALANDTSKIPAPVLSRFQQFEIQEPSAEQAAAIAARIYEKLRKQSSWGYIFHESLDEEVAAVCAKNGNPRSMRLALEGAFAKAARQGRGNLVVDDIQIQEGGQKKRRMGFL